MNVKKIKPVFTGILTTADVYEYDSATVGGIITKNKGALKEIQKVLAVGSSVRDVKAGDYICINPIRYRVMKHQEGSLKDGVITDNMVARYNFPIIELDGVNHLLLEDRDVQYIVEDFEEDIPNQGIIQPDKAIIV